MATASSSTTTNSSGDQQPQPETGNQDPVGAAVKLEDFLNSGRTGRRNALPDIQHAPWAQVSTGELPTDFSRLSCQGISTV